MVSQSLVALSVLVATAAAAPEAAAATAAASAFVSSNVSVDSLCNPSNIKPLLWYRGARVTINSMRGMLQRGGTGGVDRGDWIVAQGLSAANDCFDCQMNYWLDKDRGQVLEYVTDVKVPKTDGSARYNRATRTAREVGGYANHGLSRYYVTAPLEGGVRHEEEWTIIGADEKNYHDSCGEYGCWVMMYYCGGAAGVNTAYEGAILLTPDGMMPKEPAQVARIDSIFKANGLDPKCYPNNSDCGDHPKPPVPNPSLSHFAPANQFLQVV